MQVDERIDIGSRIGPYELREQLGEGGMASVYKVWHTGLHRFEALKLPRYQPGSNSDPAYLQRLLTEARTAARLHHPHIVAIHNVSEPEAPVHFFVMDLVNGCDLAKLLEQKQRLTVPEIVPILRQVASALDYAHANGVIHRDIKPANILLQEDPETGSWIAKVVDFGISRAAEDTGGTKLTRSGMIVGTPEYMSPEQSGSGEPVDARTDIYSLGIVTYEMLCGHPPFTAAADVSPMSILMKHVRDAPPAPNDSLRDLPRGVSEAIMKALAKHPNDRFQSCVEFVNELTRALEVEAATGHIPLDRPTVAIPNVNGAATIGAGDPAHVATSVALARLDGADAIVTQRQQWKRFRYSSILSGLGGLAAGAWLVYQLHSPVKQPSRVVPVTAAATPVATAPVIAAAATPPPGQRGKVTQIRRVEAIPFSHQTAPAASLPVGQKRVVQHGQNGQREVIVAVRAEGTREIGRRQLSNRVVKPPVPEIEQIGTARAPSPRVHTFHKLLPSPPQPERPRYETHTMRHSRVERPPAPRPHRPAAVSRPHPVQRAKPARPHVARVRRVANHPHPASHHGGGVPLPP